MDDYDEYDEFDDIEEQDSNELSDYDVESAGSLDGESDSGLGMPLYGGYGAGIDLEKLTDEQRDLYDNAYHSSYQATEEMDDDYVDGELDDF